LGEREESCVNSVLVLGCTRAEKGFGVVVVAALVVTNQRTTLPTGYFIGGTKTIFIGKNTF